jgi:hypothetical protein
VLIVSYDPVVFQKTSKPNLLDKNQPQRNHPLLTSDPPLTMALKLAVEGLNRVCRPFEGESLLGTPPVVDTHAGAGFSWLLLLLLDMTDQLVLHL